MDRDDQHMRADNEWLTCITCKKTYPSDELRYACDCGALLAVERPLSRYALLSPEVLRARALSQDPLDVSGVWKYREVILSLDPKHVVTHPEGRTHLYFRQKLADACSVDDLRFKHEGENPTGSFKDRGMTVAVSRAKSMGLHSVACASTGNTSAALAAYAAHAGMRAVVLVPAGKIAAGKLAQAIGYGATVIAVKGDFDAAMHLVQEAAQSLGLYLVNSLNAFRLEGQKTIILEMLEQLAGEEPDWIVVPAGNLGNTSAFGKALREAYAAGWIKRMPRILSVQAAGANPFATSFKSGLKELHPIKADTIATAIRIGDPVNWPKARTAITETQGYVTDVSDEEIMVAKRAIDGCGVGCEPASAATMAGVKKLVAEGVIKSKERIVCVLTGHMLKDPDAVLDSKSMAEIRTVDPNIKTLEGVLRRL